MAKQGRTVDLGQGRAGQGWAGLGRAGQGRAIMSHTGPHMPAQHDHSTYTIKQMLLLILRSSIWHHTCEQDRQFIVQECNLTSCSPQPRLGDGLCEPSKSPSPVQAAPQQQFVLMLLAKPDLLWSQGLDSALQSTHMNIFIRFKHDFACSQAQDQAHSCQTVAQLTYIGRPCSHESTRSCTTQGIDGTTLTKSS